MTLSLALAARCVRAALFGMLAVSGTLQAQRSRLDVLVLDSAGAPISEATVKIAGVPGDIRTNSDGVGRIHGVPAGNRLVYASRLGFGAARVPVEFRPGEATQHTITLGSEALTLAAVEVVVGRTSAALAERGYYDRQRRGQGSYMTGDRIEQLRPIRTIDLFRRMRGFKVVYDGRGYLDLRPTRGPANMADDCQTPLIFLDGVPIPARTSTREDALSAINPEMLAAIEAYSGPASIPAEFNVTGSACGVVLLWTRVEPS